MGYQFNKHYSREEARSLLPQVREWLQRLDQLRPQLHSYDKRLSALMESGNDAGGDVVNQWVRIMIGSREVLLEFQRRDILIKDIDRAQKRSHRPTRPDRSAGRMRPRTCWARAAS